MNLVVGATGPVGLGGEICRQLRSVGQPVRALVRPTANADRLANLARIGVELVHGDLRSRRSLDEACRGIETVISTSAPTRVRKFAHGLLFPLRSGLAREGCRQLHIKTSSMGVVRRGPELTAM